MYSVTYEAKGSVLEIIFLESVDSTQRYLIEKLKTSELAAPIAVVANRQEAGVGSRGNRWEGLEGNLFLSFAQKIGDLPQDLPLASASIYFSFLLKDVLSSVGSAVWLKWPNDFYLQSRKIGGTITSKIQENLVCGMGLNLVCAPEGFGVLDIPIERSLLLDLFFRALKSPPSWKQIFSKYELEFERSKAFHAHVEGGQVALDNAMLCEDGSLEINTKRVYCLR